MPNPIPFNLNHEIRFKPLPAAHHIYAEHYRRYGVQPPPLKEDADGWCTMQLWDFANIFGPHLGMGFEPPVETEIQLIPPSY